MNLVTMSNKPEEKKLEPVKWFKESDEELIEPEWDSEGPFDIYEEFLRFLNKDELANLGYDYKPEEKKLEPVKWSKELDEELKRLIEESKASVNWTEVAKWEAEGRPYEIEEEILLFLNKDELTNLESNGTENCGINGRRKRAYGEAFYTSSEKRNYTSEKECDSKTSTNESTTTKRNHRQYHNKVVGSHQISSLIGIHSKNDQ